MICKPCRKRADNPKKPGCSKPCALPAGCDCQHKGNRNKKVEPSKPQPPEE